MKVLVACEESQTVCIEFRKLGHLAFSCDLLDCSGGHSEWHIKADVLTLLNGNCGFKTMDNQEHYIDSKWDLIIAHPPCTHLASSGARHFIKKIADGRQQQGIDFFMEFTKADCEKIAIENPVGIMSSKYRKPNQIIQPYFFGDSAKKTTCLWLKGLPNLIPTNIVNPGEFYISPSGKKMPKWCCDPTDENGKKISYNSEKIKILRSKTFIGIAKAMASQWGN
jgi:hypothetical protein